MAQTALLGTAYHIWRLHGRHLDLKQFKDEDGANTMFRNISELFDPSENFQI